MSTVSLTSQVWSCAHPKINGENAARAQSMRTFDPALNSVSHIVKDANDAYSGRPSYHQAANGTHGLSGLGYAGLNPTSWLALETGLRQVEFQANLPNTGFYDTLEGANRANWVAQKVGSSGGGCAVYNGPTTYTNTPFMNNGQGNMNPADQQRYMNVLYGAYDSPQIEELKVRNSFNAAKNAAKNAAQKHGHRYPVQW